MTTYTGTQTVPGGYYLSMQGWKLEAIEGASGTLPGDEQTHYRRVPLAALLVIAPLMGLLFVIALPFIGLAVVGEQALYTTIELVARGRRHVRSVLIPRR